MPRPVKGHEGRVVIGGLILWLEMFEVDEQGDDIDTTTYEDVDPITGICYENSETGKVRAAVTFQGYWDLDQNPKGNPPNLKKGQTAVQVFLYVRKVGNLRYRFPLLRIKSAKTSSDVNNKKVMVSVTAVSKSKFYCPGEPGS